MFGNAFHLFTLAGFRVRLDPSWFVLGLLITWTLAATYFPTAAPGLETAWYWGLGVAGAVALLLSIVIHEFFHAVVARRNGIPMRGITLFIFGGVAEMDRDPPTAGSEFRMAGAGPLASILIGLACWGIVVAATGVVPGPVILFVEWLGTVNLILAAFNLIPAFPLDGGRMLRAALWHWRGDLRRATRITSAIGTAFAFLLMALGVWVFVSGDLIGGIWFFVIGLFLRGLSRQAYQQVVAREALAGEPVQRFMKADPVTVPPSLPVATLVEDYVYRLHHKLYPVVEDGRLVGCVTTRDVRALPREEWPRRTVGEITVACSVNNTVRPTDDALVALRTMQRGGVSRLLVVDGDRLLGVLTMKDLLELFALKVELEQ